MHSFSFGQHNSVPVRSVLVCMLRFFFLKAVKRSRSLHVCTDGTSRGKFTVLEEDKGVSMRSVPWLEAFLGGEGMSHQRIYFVGYFVVQEACSVRKSKV